MINLEELQRIGTIIKPHGVGGEMAITVPAALDWADNIDCLICSMDGIPVPFWIESLREKSHTTLLVKFENVDSVEQTSRFIGVTVYMPLRFVVHNDDEGLEWGTFLDWKVYDNSAGYLGTIHAVDDSTPNILFLVCDGSRERIIPANEDWIVRMDQKRREIVYNLPQGVVDL